MPEVIVFLVVALAVVILVPIGVAWLLYLLTGWWVAAAIAAAIAFVVLAVIVVRLVDGIDLSK